MILVDSNTWIYYLDQVVPEHARVAPRLRALLEREELLLTTVVQMEVAHYLVRNLRGEAGPALETFFSVPAHLESLEPEDVKASVGLLVEFAHEGIGGREASLLHAAKKNGAALVCTADKPLAKVARKLGMASRDLSAR